MDPGNGTGRTCFGGGGGGAAADGSEYATGTKGPPMEPRWDRACCREPTDPRYGVLLDA